MGHREEVIKSLKRFGLPDIVFTDHATIQATVRQIPLDEIRDNLLNPRRLSYAEKQPAYKGETKYNCYFRYSKSLAHRYVIVINAKVLIVTVIKIKKRWQKRLEKHGKK